MSQTGHDSSTTADIWQKSNFGLFVVQTWATSIEVFIRGGFGARYLGLQAAAVLVLAPLWCMFKQVQNVDELGLWLFYYLMACFCHRQGIRAREKRGEVWHSYYNGFPVLMKFLPWMKCSEVTFKRTMEPLLIIGLGCLLIPNDEPLGLYIVIGGICMAFLANAWSVQNQTRLYDLNDAVIDQQGLAEDFRNRRRG
mgnify:CR=1 FL=1|tara:strand:- start:104244 stop:104831 length:588 start_codon:yes stop_codon:yes gene_type:complete